MPKIFVLRDRLAEQQARLRANDKNGGNGFQPSASATSEDAAGPSHQQQPLNLQSRPQYAPKIGKNYTCTQYNEYNSMFYFCM